MMPPDETQRTWPASCTDRVDAGVLGSPLAS